MRGERDRSELGCRSLGGQRVLIWRGVSVQKGGAEGLGSWETGKARRRDGGAEYSRYERQEKKRMTVVFNSDA